ncbi:MAG: MmcQ/YjbR family DNA-binding protein [Eubacteriales bacterium]
MNYSWLEEYILSKKGVIKEYKSEWSTHRFMLHDKMVGLYSMDSAGRSVITLKCNPQFGSMLRESFKDIRPGYYMNKVHWNSVDLNGDTPEEILKQMIDNSYELILSSLPKKVQSEILSD